MAFIECHSTKTTNSKVWPKKGKGKWLICFIKVICLTNSSESYRFLSFTYEQRLCIKTLLSVQRRCLYRFRLWLHILNKPNKLKFCIVFNCCDWSKDFFLVPAKCCSVYECSGDSKLTVDDVCLLSLPSFLLNYKQHC